MFSVDSRGNDLSAAAHAKRSSDAVGAFEIGAFEIKYEEGGEWEAQIPLVLNDAEGLVHAHYFRQIVEIRADDLGLPKCLVASV